MAGVPLNQFTPPLREAAFRRPADAFLGAFRGAFGEDFPPAPLRAAAEDEDEDEDEREDFPFGGGTVT